MIPYVAAVSAMIFVSRSSDRALERRYHAAVPVIIAATSLFLLATRPASSVFFSVVLWCFVAAGLYSLLAPFWSMPNEFLSWFSAAAGIAFINSVGNTGGFFCPYVMGAINRRTGSFRGGLVVAVNADTRVAEETGVASVGDSYYCADQSGSRAYC